MINVSILGWYGTETLGDRAILDGIFQVFNSLNTPIKINIGSLYPEFTKRTFLEDGNIYKENSKKLSFDIFDVYDKKITNKMIKSSQLIIMGGGPIMDLEELDVINKIFSKAKKLGKKTMIFGCGMGPLYNERYINIAKNMLKNTDLSIFRDKKSELMANKLYPNNNYYSDLDPAILSVIKYLQVGYDCNNSEYACINFRMISSEYKVKNNYTNDFVEIIQKMSDMYPKVLLVPMHTYAIGGDDRLFLTQLANKANRSNIEVMHKPLNLYELYDIYHCAQACIGMRYHSIVMQTILNGNNVIMDYTDKKNGKIISFLEDISSKDVIEKRYINIENIDIKIVDVLKQDSKTKKFSFDLNEYDRSLKFYREKVERLLNEKK